MIYRQLGGYCFDNALFLKIIPAGINGKISQEMTTNGTGGAMAIWDAILPLDLKGHDSTAPEKRKRWRRGRDLNPRHTFQRAHDFQSCSINHSDTSPQGVNLIFRL